MATYDVSERSAIVTGAGSGIGRAVARLLAANGAAVLVADLKPDAAEAVVAEIVAAGGTAQAFVGDVADPEVAQQAVAAANALAPLRIAVNNAGIGGANAPVGDYPVDSWRNVIEVNLNAVFYGLRAQLPAIAANGGGAVINMASVLGSVGIAGSSAYVTAKHGLLGLTKNAALEYGDQQVRVTAVGPGFIHTPLVDATLDAETQEALAAKHAAGRLGTSEEVAALVAFLASDAATFITGSYHLVDGGYAASCRTSSHSCPDLYASGHERLRRLSQHDDRGARRHDLRDPRRPPAARPDRRLRHRPRCRRRPGAARAGLEVRDEHEDRGAVPHQEHGRGVRARPADLLAALRDPPLALRARAAGRRDHAGHRDLGPEPLQRRQQVGPRRDGLPEAAPKGIEQTLVKLKAAAEADAA